MLVTARGIHWVWGSGGWVKRGTPEGLLEERVGTTARCWLHGVCEQGVRKEPDTRDDVQVATYVQSRKQEFMACAHEMTYKYTT